MIEQFTVILKGGTVARGLYAPLMDRYCVVVDWPEERYVYVSDGGQVWYTECVHDLFATSSTDFWEQLHQMDS